MKRIFWALLFFFPLMACTDLKYVSLEDTTEQSWQVIPPADKKEQEKRELTVTPPPALQKAPQQQEKQPPMNAPYQTPLAGSAWEMQIKKSYIQVVPMLSLDIDLPDEEIVIPPRDRRNIFALNLGTILTTPQLADSHFDPFGAFFYKSQSPDDRRRFRGTFAGLANFVDYADGTWNEAGFEVLLHAENQTIPVERAEIIEGDEATFTDLEYGSVLGGVGIGWRTPLPPYHHDSYLTLQLFYELSYFYATAPEDFEPGVVLPPDTPEHGLHLQLRIDTFDRNFVELPHYGWAAGGDVIVRRRESWSDHQFSDVLVFSREDTRDYLQIRGFFITALPVPYASQRHRLILSTHGGWMPSQNWDRFSALRIGGGPPPKETGDLNRQPFPGAFFNQFLSEKYLIAAAEYRFEFEFFLYLHLRGTFIWGDFGFLRNNELETREAGTAFSVAITTGFVANSLLYLEYSLDDGFVRQGKAGQSLLISWSRGF